MRKKVIETVENLFIIILLSKEIDLTRNFFISIIKLVGKRIKFLSKKIIAKLCKIFGISALITAFGGTSCSDMFPRDSACLYGVPGNIFDLNGEVIDIKGNAIQGIEINVKVNAESASKSDSDPLNEERDSKTYLDSTTTDENGKFNLHWHCQNESYIDFIIEAKDVDGELNGSYDDATETVSYRVADVEGKSPFGNIEYNKDLKIQLSEKQLFKLKQKQK